VHGVLALSLLQATLGPLSIPVLVLLMFSVGPGRTAGIAGGALALLATAGLLSGGVVALAAVTQGALLVWAPAALLALATLRLRSLTLTLQAAVLLIAVAIVVAFVAVPEQGAFWQAVLSRWAEEWRAQGATQLADVIGQLSVEELESLSLAIALAFWFLHSGLFVAGYALAGRAGYAPVAGRFIDVSLGKVIAALMAVTSLAAVLTQSTLLGSLAVFLFGAFWIHGLAIVHWFHAETRLPDGGLAMIYAGAIVLMFTAVPLALLALAGYADAWYPLRRRKAA